MTIVFQMIQSIIITTHKINLSIVSIKDNLIIKTIKIINKANRFNMKLFILTFINKNLIIHINNPNNHQLMIVHQIRWKMKIKLNIKRVIVTFKLITKA